MSGENDSFLGQSRIENTSYGYFAVNYAHFRQILKSLVVFFRSHLVDGLQKITGSQLETPCQ